MTFSLSVSFVPTKHAETDKTTVVRLILIKVLKSALELLHTVRQFEENCLSLPFPERTIKQRFIGISIVFGIVEP
ncbi:MAG: hypothetical protein NPIRA05_13120 [Nitrospirales bacterium]|nr:MAG: hypothetical protein NPIRA05_13120 [Nitrospirales bacterium]